MKTYTKLTISLLLVSQIYTHSLSAQCVVFNQTTVSQTQTWTVPNGGPYRIKITAKGGKGGNNGQSDGGKGAKIIGEFTVITGQVLEARSGNQGTNNVMVGSNGGDATVVKMQGATLPMIVAAGGGGASDIGTGSSAGQIPNGDNSGIGGSGGGASANAAGGGGSGGYLQNGQNGSNSGSYTGGTGGSTGFNPTGGLGGNGSLQPNINPMIPGMTQYTGGGGGGGGFVGGNGGGSQYTGNGGVSYNTGTNQINTADENNGNGSVVIELFDAPKSLFVSANTPTTTGSSAGVSVPDHNNLDLTTELTLEAWIKPTTFTPNSWQGSIISKDYWAGDIETGYVLRCGSTGILDFTYGDGTAWRSFVTSTNALTLNVWQHIAVTFKQNVGVSIYINGVLQTLATTGIFTAAISTNPQNLGIGTNLYDANKRNFKGNIDNVKIWNKVLSAPEISFHKEYKPCLTSNLMVFFELNETTGTNVPNTITGGVGNGTILTSGTTATYSWQCEGENLRVFSNTKVYVKNNATGDNNGTSWADAFVNLQDGINNFCNIDSVWVAAGTYFPTVDFNLNPSPADVRTKSFVLRDASKTFGGFIGTETQFKQRNWRLNETILSGDIGTIGINTDNAYNVVISNSNPYTTRLDGFTVEKGYASNSSSPTVLGNSGGGIIIASDADFYNLKIRNNYAVSKGGGIYIHDGSPYFFNCDITQNQSPSGGGVFNNAVQNYTTFVRCLFSANTGGSVYTAGYIAFHYSVFENSNTQINGFDIYSVAGELNIFNSTFVSNIISNNSISVNGGKITATNSIFWNEGFRGGIVITGNILPANIIFSGCDFKNTPPAGNNNISLDPKFIDATNPKGEDGIWRTADDGLALQFCSPLLDIGYTYSNMAGTDFLLNARINMPNVGSTATNTVDIGAYEFVGNGKNSTVNTNITSGTSTVSADKVVATNQISGATVEYNARQSIILNPGFSVTSDVFKAQIVGCQ